MQMLTDVKTLIIRETADQPHLDPIRGFNHTMVGELAKTCPLSGRALLDVGASVHGYALEAALEHGVVLYEGVGIGVSRRWKSQRVEFTSPDGRIGRLREMNAEQLEFPEESFDCLLSGSTFEHFLRPATVLAEMHRVLRPEGVALVSFDGVWSCSYGYHLLQLGEEINNRVPPWSHLFLTEDKMRGLLGGKMWPPGAPIDLEGALRWIYRSEDLNRIGIRELEGAFERSELEIQWIVRLMDEKADEYRPISEYLSLFLPYTTEELLTRGLSLLLRKK